MHTIRHKILLSTALLITITVSARADLRGVVLRDVVDPFSTGTTTVRGLATDGTSLYFANDGTNQIRVVDLASLAIQRVIELPVTNLHGLEYHDGLLFGSILRLNEQDGNPSRIYRISPITGEVVSFFDAPENGITEFSVGPDALMYASDGFFDRSSAGSKVHSFDPDTGQWVSTAVARLIDLGGPPPPVIVPEMSGASVIQWLPDDTLMLGDLTGRLRLVTIKNGILIPRDFVIDGRQLAWEGSAIAGDRLYLTGWSLVGSTLVDRFYEVQLIPEPSTLLLVLALLPFTCGVLWRRSCVCSIASSTTARG
jgi:hypothetical protein